MTPATVVRVALLPVAAAAIGVVGGVTLACAEMWASHRRYQRRKAKRCGAVTVTLTADTSGYEAAMRKITAQTSARTRATPTTRYHSTGAAYMPPEFAMPLDFIQRAVLCSLAGDKEGARRALRRANRLATDRKAALDEMAREAEAAGAYEWEADHPEAFTCQGCGAAVPCRKPCGEQP